MVGIGDGDEEMVGYKVVGSGDGSEVGISVGTVVVGLGVGNCVCDPPPQSQHMSFELKSSSS